MLIAMFGNPVEMAVIAGVAVLLFGGGKIRDVARGLGAAKKEFMVGQAEADIAAERARAEARAQAEVRAANEGRMPGETTSTGASLGTPAAPPQV